MKVVAPSLKRWMMKIKSVRVVFSPEYLHIPIGRGH